MEAENKNIKTYAEDLAKVVEGNEPGLIKKIIEEQEKNEAFNANVSPFSKRNKLFIIFGVFLGVLAIALVSFIFVFQQKIFTTTVVPQYVPIIFTDQNQFFEISGSNKEKVISDIVAEVNKSKIQTGEVQGINLVENKKLISFKRLISFIEGNLTAGQLKPISDNFLMGIVNAKATDFTVPASKNLFFLLKINFLPDAFNSLKTWEAKMLYDLHGFFSLDLNAETNYLFTKDFEDGFVLNKNARVLYDHSGQVVLMYVFIDSNYIIISKDIDTTLEVMNRIFSSKTAK